MDKKLVDATPNRLLDRIGGSRRIFLDTHDKEVTENREREQHEKQRARDGNDMKRIPAKLVRMHPRDEKKYPHPRGKYRVYAKGNPKHNEKKLKGKYRKMQTKRKTKRE